jgi:hypothetical protein
MFVNPGFSTLLRIFNANNVRYLVIEGYAAVQYAGPGFTKDLDSWIGTELNVISADQSVNEFDAQLAVS